MSADAGFDPTPFIDADKALEQRVAALEAALLPGRPLKPFDMPPLTGEQEAELRREFDETMRGPFTYRVRPSSLTALDPETVRQLLRECVTVVKPGEVLFFTAGDPNCTPGHLREIQDAVNWWLEHNAPDVRVMVLPHGEFAVAESEPGFLKDCRIDVYRAGLPGQVPPAVRITHLPTGVTAEASGDSELSARREAIRKLATALATSGDISINDGRRALGLPEWDGGQYDTAQAFPGGVIPEACG